MQLALTMRIPDVDLLLRSISGQQFLEWMVYSETEPFGDLRADYRIASLAALIANIYRDPDKTGEFSAKDFLLKFEPEGAAPQMDKETALAAIRELMMGMVAATGGEDLRPKQ
jgi:hypothetical protein